MRLPNSLCMTSPGCLSTVCFVSEMKQGFENERQSWSGEAIVISEIYLIYLLENEALGAGNFGFGAHVSHRCAGPVLMARSHCGFQWAISASILLETEHLPPVCPEQWGKSQGWKAAELIQVKEAAGWGNWGLLTMAIASPMCRVWVKCHCSIPEPCGCWPDTGRF